MDTFDIDETAIMSTFEVTPLAFIERTAIATIWKVAHSDGTPAALKIYDNQNMRNERPGFAFLSALDGHGAANVYEVTKGEALLEWLDGPSLGDLSRDGNDAEACAELVAVANRLHSRMWNAPDCWPRLENWFSSLFKLKLSPELDPSAVKKTFIVVTRWRGDFCHLRLTSGRFMEISTTTMFVWESAATAPSTQKVLSANERMNWRTPFEIQKVLPTWLVIPAEYDASQRFGASVLM